MEVIEILPLVDILLLFFFFFLNYISTQTMFHFDDICCYVWIDFVISSIDQPKPFTKYDLAEICQTRTKSFASL